jgi:hypothetical protein
MDTEPIPLDHFDNIVLPPKKPRLKPKRLASKDEIIAKIDKFTAKAKKQRAKAEELMRDAKTLRELSAKEELDSPESIKLSGSAARKEDQANGWAKKAGRIEDRVLAPLKNKLAEFQTETIPGFLPDNSVEGV